MEQPRPQPTGIGERARRIRVRRGLSLDTAAGLAGITKGYLSLLERGHRRFSNRALLEDLAEALSCSVIDLTGQPYPPGDRMSAEALATIPGIRVALHDTTVDDAPDVPARPLDVLAALAARANEDSAHSRYSMAGHDLGTVITELHVHLLTGAGDVRRGATAALAEAYFVACGCARSLGYLDLAVQAGQRSYELAQMLESPALVGFATMTRMGALSRVGARNRARSLADAGLAEVESMADPSSVDTGPAEAYGMLHLSAAHLAAKGGNHGLAVDHLQAAGEVAERTGERNMLFFSFGPANVRAWSLAVAVESGRGPAAAERIERLPNIEDGLPTADRRAAIHFDLARAYAQAEGARDQDAIRHLDMSDRIAPQRVRLDPTARELLEELDGRAVMRSWELESLRNRLGLQLVND